MRIPRAALFMLLIPLLAAPARAMTLEAAVGGTGAAGGAFDQGGFSVSAAVLWPIESLPLRVGVMAHADDIGTRVDPVYDVHDGQYLGNTESGHRAAYGASWRIDASLAHWRGWVPEAGGSWGYYRLADDLRGHITSSVGSTGVGLALGVHHAVGLSNTAGLVLRYHRLFNDVADRYVSGAFTWRWSGRSTP